MSACLADQDVVGLVEGDVDDRRRGELLAHLDGCDGCRRLVAELAGSGGGAPALVVPAESTVDRYVIREVVGAGAMGVVYRAFDPRLGRDVALKLLRPHVDPASGAGERLLAEAHALARLAHPNVIAVFDVGTHDGQVYVAMELGGETLTSWLARRPPFRERLRILRQVGEGLAAAHATGILHRDIKPENILIGTDGRARVTDFGLAGAVGAGEPGALVGTPAYLAPAQLGGAPADESSDQYAYAMVLFEALTGERPYSAGSIAALREAAARGRVPRKGLPRWLRRIVARGLAPPPRFPSVRALLAAIDRGPPLTPVRIAVGATALASLAAIAGVATYSFGRIEAARDSAVAQRDELVVLEARHALDRDPTAALAWLKALSPQAASWRDAVGVAREALARGVSTSVHRGHAGGAAYLAVSPDGERLAVAARDGSVHLWRGDVETVLPADGTGDVGPLAFSDDGHRFASSRSRRVTVWDTTSLAASASAEFPDDVAALRFAGDELVVAAEDGSVHAFRGKRLIGQAEDTCEALAVSPDGRTLAAGCVDRAIHLWPMAGGPARLVATAIVHPHGVAFVGMDELAVGGINGLELVPLEGLGRQRLEGHHGSVEDVSAAGGLLLSGGKDHSARVWDLARGAEIAVLSGHDAGVGAVALLADGRAVTASDDGSVRTWRVPRSPATILAAGEAPIVALAVAPDGTHVAASEDDGKIRVFDLAGRAATLRQTGSSARRLLYDGRDLVAGARDGTVTVFADAARELAPPGSAAIVALAAKGGRVAWMNDTRLEIASGERRETVTVHPGGSVGFFGARLVFADGYDLVSCDPAACAATRKTLLENPAWIAALATSPHLVAFATHAGAITVSDGKSVLCRFAAGREQSALAISPDETLVAAGGPDGIVRAFDLRDGKVREVARHENAVVSLGFRGAEVVSGAADGTLHIGDRTLRGHTGFVALAVLPDGRIVSGGEEGSLRLWPLASEDEPPATRAELDALVAAATSAVIDPAGLATTPPSSSSDRSGRR